MGNEIATKRTKSAKGGKEMNHGLETSIQYLASSIQKLTLAKHAKIAIKGRRPMASPPIRANP